MSKPIIAKKLSNPISTGGAGVLFENEVQSSFVLLMLSKGVFSPKNQVFNIIIYISCQS